MPRKSNPHLYTHGGKKAHLPEFKERYGERGAQVYGAVVGQVRRQRMARGLCRASGCGTPAKPGHRHGDNECCGHPLHCAEILGAEQRSSTPAFGPTSDDYLMGVP